METLFLLLTPGSLQTTASNKHAKADSKSDLLWTTRCYSPEEIRLRENLEFNAVQS
jgi:hypothetical protein